MEQLLGADIHFVTAKAASTKLGIDHAGDTTEIFVHQLRKLMIARESLRKSDHGIVALKGRVQCSI